MLFRKNKTNDYHDYFCAKTDTGRERNHNEDYYLANIEKNLYIIADGVGGNDAGEVASKEASEFIEKNLTMEVLATFKDNNEYIKPRLDELLNQTNGYIKDLANDNSARSGMACTMVVVLCIDGMLHISHIGDSRAYLSTEERLEMLTQDHSVVMELVEAGHMSLEEAIHSPIKNRITQTIGSQGDVEPSYTSCTLSSGDKLLLCTDGLSDMLTDDEIYEICKQDSTPEDICSELINSANQAGGEDNITVLLLFNQEKL